MHAAALTDFDMESGFVRRTESAVLRMISWLVKGGILKAGFFETCEHQRETSAKYTTLRGI
jgi:hypothetical protein